MCAGGSFIHVRRISKGSHLEFILYEGIKSQKLRTCTLIAGGGTISDKSITRMVQCFKAKYFNELGALLGAIRAFQIESHSDLLQVMRSFYCLAPCSRILNR